MSWMENLRAWWDTNSKMVDELYDRKQKEFLDKKHERRNRKFAERQNRK